MSLVTSIAYFVAVVCGVAAVVLVALYFVLKYYVERQRKVALAAKRKKKKAAEKEKPSEQSSERTGSESGELIHRAPSTTRDGIAPKRSGPLARDPEVVQREQDLKREALHVFRQLQNAETKEDQIKLCKEAVKLFDGLETRVGPSMASLTSAKIIFCNALMECGGLGELQTYKDTEDPSATALIERVVPVIFSS